MKELDQTIASLKENLKLLGEDMYVLAITELLAERDELKKSRDRHLKLAINVQIELQTLLKALKILNK